MLYTMEILQNWVSHTKSHGHDILNETKQIQLSTENEIDQVVEDQRRIQEDMDQLQGRLRRIEDRRKQRQDVLVQHE
jgi:small-conductance mechanosensitive channel